jgi:pantetheine-phosphate adenylyltransferase
VSDFEYEFQMVAMNQKMNDDIETVFLMADPAHQAVSSRLVKEIARLGGRADLFVPAAVNEKLNAKFGSKKGR